MGTVQIWSIDSRDSQKTIDGRGAIMVCKQHKIRARQESTREQGSRTKKSRYTNNGDRRCQTFDALLHEKATDFKPRRGAVLAERRCAMNSGGGRV